MAASSAPSTSEMVQEIHTPFRPPHCQSSNRWGMSTLMGARNSTWRDRLVVMAIQGLSID